MAIDTAAKRRAASGIPFLPLGPGVTPNVDRDAFWRATVAWSYSGLTIIKASLVLGRVFMYPLIDGLVSAYPAVDGEVSGNSYPK